MLTGWRYRVVSVLGAVVITVAAVYFANHELPQYVLTTYVPRFWRLSPEFLDQPTLEIALMVTILFVLVTAVPLFKPQPRRQLDTIALSVQRVIIAMLGLAALGYYNFTYRLPRSTLTLIGAFLVIALPIWFVAIRQNPAGSPDRAVIVGDDPEMIQRIADANDLPFIGYLAPWNVRERILEQREPTPVATDGGALSGVPRLGGLSRLDEILVDQDVDLAVLAFQSADRGEFFGAIDTCHERGVAAKVHRDFQDAVLVSGTASGDLVDIEVEPWDAQDYVLKRIFDVSFATVGLIVSIPLIVVIAIAIKLEDGGAILFHQERTAGFGDQFPVYKFRTMRAKSEENESTDDRITRVGRVLRLTHLDEIPQLWSILLGQMSVVGPRATWTDEELLLEERAESWRKRWFVKPGLTGLAQIHDVTSDDPEAKLRYDLEYIRRQSIWLDMKIVIRQFWKVGRDVRATVRESK